MPSDSNQWSDYVLGWRFQYRLDPLGVVGEGPLDDGWRLSVLLLPNAGRLVVAEVKVFPDGDRQKVTTERETLDTKVWLRIWSEDASALDPEHPAITARLLRKIRLDEIVRLVQEQWANDLDRADRSEWEKLLGEKPSAIAAEFARSIDLERRPVGRPPRDETARRDVELAKIASLYVDALQAGSRSPIKDIAESLSISRSSVRDAKFRAVEKGYLVGTQDRKAAGVLSKRAIEILEAAAREGE